MSDLRRDFEGCGKDWRVPIISYDGKPLPIFEPALGDTVTAAVCAWCGALLRGAPNAPPNQVSHGICPDCAAKEMGEVVG